MSTQENEMLALFIQEAEEHLQTLDNDLILLESNPHDQEGINRVFRAVHSIKGTAGFFGFSGIVELAHAMENVMSLVRDGEMPVSPELINIFLAATDKLKIMVHDPDRSSEVDVNYELSSLSRMLSQEPAESKASPESVLPSYLLQFNIDPIIVRDGLRHGRNFFVLELRLHADIENQNQTILEFFNELDSLGDIIATSTDVGLEACTGLQEEIRPDLICSVFFCTPMEDTLLLGAFNLPPSTITPVPKEPLQEWIRTQPKLVPSQYSTKHQIQEEPTPPRSHQVHESKLVPVTQAKSRDDNKLIPTTPPSQEITPATLQTRPHQPQSQDKTEPTTNIQSFRIKTEETVRLNVSILDTLMNLAGEMVVGRNKLVRCAEAGLGPDSIGELQAIVQQISTVTSDLQRTVMAARLQPVGNLFGKFNRIVRDLGQKLHKEIRLEILGEDVELDRTLLEGLSDPLTHLVRNAADHGLEPPEERRAAGKPPVGRIRLAAAHFHGRVQIEVRDDGRGLNPQKIRNKAVERGIISAEAAARMSDQEACRLIFMPGFSTASTVTDISGRGVGMDVVKTNIEKLGGTVDLESEPGRGTAVIIRLPLTLAIIPALIVSCGGRRFAMPQINVEEIVAPGPDYPLEILGGAQVLRLRNELVPILDLAHILGQKRTKEQDQAQRFALIIGLDHARYGLLVDEIDNMEEIVVKPLGRLLKGVPWYSGATLLGQGDIALILEPAALAEGRLPQDGIQDVEVTKSQSSISQESHAQRILVFRDGTHERFAIPLSVISRVERVPSSRIERIGSKECLRQADNRSTLQLLRVANYIPVTPPPDYEEEVYVIVPRLVHHAIGIMASEIVDSADIYPGQIDSSVVSAPGLLGTATVLDRLTSVIDIYGLLEVAGFTQQNNETAKLANLRVLLAEDTSFFREAVLRALQHVVAKLDLANDGEEAWKMLNEKEYDVLITDIEMPKLDGFALTERIRSSTKLCSLPVIALSARDSESFLNRAKQVGIDHYETKFDRDRIIAAVLKVISQQNE